MDPYQELTLYQRSAILMAAAQLGVFAAMADGPADPLKIADTVGTSEDTIARLLAALRALDYIGKTDGKYVLNDFSRSFLRDGAGGMVRLAWKEHLFYTAWSRLAAALSSNQALFPSYRDRISGDFPSVEKFLLALNDLAGLAAPGIVASGFLPEQGTLLDLGGGGGGYAAAIAVARPAVRVTLADLPEILPISEGYLARQGLLSRVEVTTADFLKDGCGLPGRTFDTVYLSHILHDFDAATAAQIVRRAGALVAPGGRLLILDVLVPEAGQDNGVEGLFDLMMLVEVPGGRSHPVAAVRSWLAAAGLPKARFHKLYFGVLAEGRAE